MVASLSACRTGNPSQGFKVALGLDAARYRRAIGSTIGLAFFCLGWFRYARKVPGVFRG
jgi:hypothetical protein